MNVWLKIRKTVFEVSQAEFAALLGVHQSTVSRWERGELAPSLNEWAAIRRLAKEKDEKWSEDWVFEALHRSDDEPLQETG